MTPKNYRREHDHNKPVKRKLCLAIKPTKLECQNPAGYGTDHPGMGPCKHHFGNTARVVRGAALEEGKELVQMLRGMGVSIDMDPGEALRWEVNNALGHIAWHRKVIDTWDLLNSDGSARALTEDESVFYDRYLAERQHLVRAARMAIAADVEGRAIRLAEKEAMTLANAIDQVLAALHLTSDQRSLIPQVVPDILRSVAEERPLELEGVFSTDDDLNAAIVASRKKEQK